MDERQLKQIRSFNRTVTRHIGALDANYLGRGRPLAESRLLFEIGLEGMNVKALRARLALDSGYLSRLLRALERQGLVRVEQSEDDARARKALLTEAGRHEYEALDVGSQSFAASMIAPLRDTQRERLVAAMAEVERLMRASLVETRVVDPTTPQAKYCLAAYVREIDARFEGGFDPTCGPTANPHELVPPAGLFLVAYLDDEPIGCGALKVLASGVGEIKRMWVAPAARGLGIAQRLLSDLERHGVDLGLSVMRLDTHRSLIEARAMYERSGYRQIPRYNDNPYADYWFEKHLPKLRGT